jgi:flagellar hook-associated protein 1 FlgK
VPLETLRIVKASLAAHQAALEVVSQNLANAATPAYTRQRPVLLPIATARLFDPARAGQGVRLEYVQRLWDAHLAADINLQRGLHKEAEISAQALEQVEALLGDNEQGLVGLVTAFFNAWTELGSDGASLAARRAVVGAAQALADTLRDRVQRLLTLQQELDTRLQQAVQRANALLERVAELNGQVIGNQGTVGAGNAATQRDQALQEIAELVGGVGVAQEDGTVSVFIGGLAVVDGVRALRLELVPDPAQPALHQVRVGGHVDPEGLSGQVRGLLAVRDQRLPAYLQRLEEFAATLAAAVNAQHRAGYDLSGAPGGDFFTYQKGFAAGSLRVAADLASDVSKLAASSVPAASSDGQNAFALGALRYQGLFGTLTAEQYAADVLAQVGAEVGVAQQAALTRANLLDTLEARYQERYGVVVDEEAMEILKYQKAFLACARVAQAVSEMMDSVLQMGR